MRLIDADELFRKATDIIRDKENIYKDYAIVKAIIMADTVDSEPVRHGKWIKTPNEVRKNINTEKMMMCYKYDCNICGFHTGNQGLKFHYCPNCGTKMDGGISDGIDG